MMMEQQTALKNDEMQEKWKNCIKVTCNLFNIYGVLRECAQNLMETLRAIINNIKETLSDTFSKLSEALKEFKEIIQEYHKKEESNNFQSYPHSYPRYVDKLKLNVRGFPQPIMRCARSRC